MRMSFKKERTCELGLQIIIFHKEETGKPEGTIRELSQCPCSRMLGGGRSLCQVTNKLPCKVSKLIRGLMGNYQVK